MVGLIGDVQGKHALIVDDEIASGGTMIEAARYLHAHGVVGVEAAIVHPVLSGQAVERIDESSIQRLVVTNTLPVGPEKHSPKLEYVSVAALLARAIRAIHEGDSVSSLFT